MPVIGCVVGVGRSSDDEQAGTLVAGANIGRAYKRPLDIEPERIKVRENLVEPKGEVSSHILQDDEARS